MEGIEKGEPLGSDSPCEQWGIAFEIGY